jgi:hypothetical protein
MPVPDFTLPDFTMPDLPVAECLPRLIAVLGLQSNAVLVAPPGAGKTTSVPLALLGAAPMNQGRILMLEPRRLAARAAASRMAKLIGEEVGPHDRISHPAGKRRIRRHPYRSGDHWPVGAPPAGRSRIGGCFRRHSRRNP